jgi:diguanylate cyclase
MDNNAIQQQLNQWKQKYYQALSDIEQQKDFDSLLRRSLSRLALAAQGLDPALDTQLDALRNNLRRKSQEQKEIEHILEEMEKALLNIEQNKTPQQTTGEALADLLKSLNLAKPLKAEARQLAKQFMLSTTPELVRLLPQLNVLLNKCLATNDKKSTGNGFSFNLFRSNKKDIELSDSPLSVEDNLPVSDIDIQTAEPSKKRPPTHILLMQLLERLSLPTNLTKRATKIRHHIQAGINEQHLPKVIDEIADIISALGSQAMAEKREYETFLKSLTTRLNQLDEHIHISSDQDIKAFKDRHNLGLAVDKEVEGIMSDIVVADDLQRLKSTVNQRFDFLNQHFDSYRQSDKTQFKQSQNQIQALKQRIHLMEQESIELRQTAMKSRDLALKDPLTGIWNRQALNEALEKEYTRWQRYKKPLSIILWDIDLFKNINDQYGHAAGDKVLKTIAQIFTSHTRDADFVARYGGEEFMGIFPETQLHDAHGLANKIREKIAQFKFHYEDNAVNISVSAGLACFTGNDDIEDVFKRADKALYKAKANGRNCCLTEE